MTHPMATPRPPLPSGPWLVVGLARSGVAAALALRERGEDVRGVDAGRPEQAAAKLRAAGVGVTLGTDGVDALRGVRAVVKSPGVPAQAPVVAAARERGLTVLGELELGWRLLPNEVVAVTGTNGKTTTVELIGHIHREAGLPVAVAGNVGTALASLAGTLSGDDGRGLRGVVLPARGHARLRPEAAVLLNLAPDHLDRHGTLEAYRDAKLRIFAHQGNDDVAVAPVGLGVEDLGGCARRVCFGAGPSAELADRAGQLWWDDEPLLGVDELALRGPHNRANAMAARPPRLARGRGPRRRARRRCAPSRAWSTASRRSPAGRRPLRQRLEGDERRLDARRAGRFDAPVHLILGGQGKGAGLRAAARRRSRRASRAAYLIGEDADAIARRARGRGRAAPLRRPRAAVAAARARRRGPATSSCCRPPARASTSTRTSRPAAGTSRRWSAA